jgi:hydroxymethylbilane synthase
VKGATIKVGTRGSRLALTQTEMVLKTLRSLHPRHNFVAVPIRTAGDRITSAAELRSAGKGLFVKEIERALLSRKIRMAVHSMKDLPSEIPEGLTIGAIPERVDPSDVFIGRNGILLEKLPPGSTIGTSSLRRQAILKAIYPHLRFAELKGNLDTRLEKLRHPRSSLAGIVVAAAGILRLYPQDGVPVQPLPTDVIVPAAGQGALGLEIREADEEMRRLLEPIHHAPTAACVTAERELLRRLEGGCQVPLGAYGETSEDGLIRLIACLASPDGKRMIRESQTGMADDPGGIAEALETILNSRGAQEILAPLRPRSSGAGRRRPAKRRSPARSARRPRPRRSKARARR